MIPPPSGVLDLFSARIFTRRNFTPKLFFIHLHPSPHPRFLTMLPLESQSNRATTYKRVLSLDTINPAILSARYAVRGELALRANELTEQLKNNQTNLPFKDVVHCEIGNPQALDQKPLTFIRQVFEYIIDPDN